MGRTKKRDIGTIDSGSGEFETGNIDNQDGFVGNSGESSIGDSGTTESDRRTGETERGTGETERGTGETERGTEGRIRTRTRIADRTGRNNSRGKTGRKTKTADSIYLNGETVTGLNHVLASLLKMPELAISIDEGNALAESINTVCKEYNLIVDSKTAALIGLITTAGMVYVPRFGAAIKRIKSERMKQTENLNRYEQREPVIHAENNGERPAPNLNNPPGMGEMA